MPASSYGVRNDGGVIYGLKRKDDVSKVTLALLSIQAQMYQGKTPAQVDEKLYFDLPQLPEDDYNFIMLLNARYLYYLDKEDYENAKKVTERLVGLVEDAIKDARVNSEANGINNTIFFSGDMKDVLTDEFISVHGRPDVMIVDPPRAGMHGDVVNVILNARPERIVYVSCNPATQARDLALLDVAYQVVAVQPVDMFPHTHHVENVVKLVLKS